MRPTSCSLFSSDKLLPRSVENQRLILVGKSYIGLKVDHFQGNDITLQYTHREQTHPDRENTIEFKIFEDKFQRVDGQRATREHLLMALADLDTLLIKVGSRLLQVLVC